MPRNSHAMLGGSPSKCQWHKRRVFHRQGIQTDLVPKKGLNHSRLSLALVVLDCNTRGCTF
jgi:hypothetical protein